MVCKKEGSYTIGNYIEFKKYMKSIIAPAPVVILTNSHLDKYSSR